MNNNTKSMLSVLFMCFCLMPIFAGKTISARFQPRLMQQNTSQQNTTWLRDSIAQVSQIPRYKDKAQFKIKLQAEGNATLTITQFVGKVQTFYTKQSDHLRKPCLNNYCVFSGLINDIFNIQVLGNSNEVQRFSIVYKQAKKCYVFRVGTPVFVQLDPKQQDCIDFQILPQFPYQLSTSLTALQLLDFVAEIAIQFLQTNYTLAMVQSSYIFSSDDLQKFCPQATSSPNSPCKVRVKFIAFQDSANFHFVMQKVDGIITLYDGVSQKMNTVIDGKTTGKYFRYPLNVDKSVQIFLLSQSNSDYVITAKITEGSLTSQLDSIPLPSTPVGTGVWRITSSDDSPAITFLPISKLKLKPEFLNQQIRNPWLVISVFGKQQQSQHVIFTIQVTQNQRMLKQGEQHVGFLEPKQIVTYQVYPSTISMLSVRSLYNNRNCFTLLDQNKKPISNQVYIQSPRTLPLRYYIESDRVNSCMYQISLQDFTNSILTLNQGFPSQAIVEYRQTAYFLYYHNNNQTFRIYQFIQSGSSLVYATPLNISNSTKGIKQIIDDISLSKYKYHGDLVENLQIQASDNEQKYCYNCYYAIAVKGNPSVHQDIVVVKDSTPVTIKDHSIVDSYLDQGQNQTFIYYSGAASKFNLSIDVVYGKITVTVKGYQKQGKIGRVIRVQTVQKNTVTIPVVEKTDPLSFQLPTDSLDQQRKYRIQVQASQFSLYHLQVIKFSDSFRIAQGIASKFIIPAKGQIDLQFDNYLSQGTIDVNLQTKSYIYPIESIIQYSPFNYQSNKNIQIYPTTTRFGKVINLNFESKRGHYKIKLTNYGQIGEVEVIALMPRPGVNQLREDHSVVSNKQNVYQIYIQDGNYAMIQVFDCQGNMKVRGSNELQDVTRGTPRDKQISLLHENIGGHFVVTTPKNVSGQYFIRIQNKQYTGGINDKIGGISYMIRYQTLLNNQKNPYSSLDANNFLITVKSIPKSPNITIILNGIYSRDPNIIVKSVKYLFAIGSSVDDVKDYIICQTTKDVKHLSFAITTQGSKELVTVQHKKIDIVKLLGKNRQAFIGAVALVQVQYDNKQTYNDLAFVYQPSYLGQFQQRKVITATGFFEIMVIVCTIIGGIVAIFSLGLYFIRRYRGYDATQLIQQDSHQKNSIGSSQLEISNQEKAQHQQKMKKQIQQ